MTTLNSNSNNPLVNTEVKIVEIDITVPSSLRTLTEADYGINGRTAIPKKLGTKEGIHIHDPKAFTSFESARNAVRNKLMTVGVKPTKSNIYYIPADKWDEVEGELNQLASDWDGMINQFVSEFDERRKKFHQQKEFAGWHQVLSRKIEDAGYFVPRFSFSWAKSYDAFDSNKELEAKMDVLGDKLLNEVVSMADKVMKTSISKRGDKGMTTKIRFPLIAMSNKLKSWVSIRPEVAQAIKDLDAVISMIPDPKANGGMVIAADSAIYKEVADIVTRFTTVDGVLGNLSADAINEQKAQDMVDALNENLASQGEETYALPEKVETASSEVAAVESDESEVETEEVDVNSELNALREMLAEPVEKPQVEVVAEELIEDEDDDEEEDYSLEESMVASEEKAKAISQQVIF